MRRRVSLLSSFGALAALTVAFGACTAQSPTKASTSPTAPPVATAVPATATTSTPACAVLVPGAAPFTGLSGVPGLVLPPGAYITVGVHTGGGSGKYAIATYTVCYQGAEAAINGGSGSTLSQLNAAGWTLNNLFPDPTNFSYLDYCSNAHTCVNSSGTPNPFTFVGFNQYASKPNGYTTFTMQVATVPAPSCLNDPQYYSGAAKYTLYEDGSSASQSGDPFRHFQMPPGTRDSTFLGGGTAGSTYIYFCSAGTQGSVVGFLQQAMSNIGWAISNSSASGFSASHGSSPTYRIDVSVQSPSNYSLRIFVPM